MDGILIVNKPKNKTSRDVVNEVCKKLGTRKVGHTGTLDPIATGVLVLGVNNGTKIIELLTANEKEYIAKVKLGIKTDTLDVTGEVLEENNDYVLEKEKLEEVLNSFIGEYNQQVPIYSAVRVNGKRLYEYARNNESIELPSRIVSIKSIELLELDENSFSFKVHVSKGTYIRSLIDDISKRLNILCTMEELKRIKQGIFNIEDSIELDNIDKNTQLTSISEALTNYDKIIVDENIENKVKNGALLDNEVRNEYLVILNEKEEALGIYIKYDKDENKMKPYKIF